MIQDKITEDELVERIAKNLYEWHHPRIYHTFEELDSHFKGSAEGIRQQAVKILSLVREEIEKCLLGETQISNALKPYWKPPSQCPTCMERHAGFYLLSPTERDKEVAKAQLQTILKALGG